MTGVSWINGLVGGLLVSSCCLIQLFLNLFGIGCAGLNTLLLPYRPLFISLTVISLTYSFFRYRPSKRHFTMIVLATALLSFSPELLRMYNNQFASNDSVDGTLVVSHWEILGMHCEGCRSAVIHALRRLDGVLGVNVNLETGRAELTSRRTISVNAVVDAVRAAGFQARELDLQS